MQLQFADLVDLTVRDGENLFSTVKSNAPLLSTKIPLAQSRGGFLFANDLIHR